MVIDANSTIANDYDYAIQGIHEDERYNAP